MANQGSTNSETPFPTTVGITRTEFVQLVQAAHRRVWLVARGMVGNATTADDIVQDATVIAWQKRFDFQPGSNFTAWLAATVRRCALNHLRKIRTQKTIATDHHSMEQIVDQAAAAGDRPTVAAGTVGELGQFQQDFDDHLLHAIQSLKEEARCCLLLRVVQELSYAEIAELMQIPQGTAMSHVHRSRQAMREYLKGNRQETN